MKALHLAFAVLMATGAVAGAQEGTIAQPSDLAHGGGFSAGGGGARPGDLAAAGGGFTGGGGGGKPEFLSMQSTILQLQSRLIQLDPTLSGGLTAGKPEADTQAGAIFEKHNYCTVLTPAEGAKECRTCWSYLNGVAGGIDCRSRIGGEVRYGECSAPENRTHCP